MVYFPDLLNFRIRTVDTRSGIIRTIIGNGTNGFVLGNTPANTTIGALFSLALLPNGEIIFSQFLSDDNNPGYILLKYTPPSTNNSATLGRITPATPTGQSGGNNLSNVTFTQVLILAADSLGNLYVGDQYVVRKITPQGAVSNFAGNGSNTDPFLFNGDQRTSARLGMVLGIDFDAQNNVYVYVIKII